MKKIYSLLSIALSAFSAINAETITFTYHYTTPLCQHLVKGEYGIFLDRGKKGAEQEWYNAIRDAILVSDKNFDARLYGKFPDVQDMLTALQSSLKYRISRIENQLINKHRFDYNALAAGTLAFAASAGLAALLYYYYKNEYKKNNIEFAQIKSDLESQGVEVNCPWYSNTIELICHGNPRYYESSGYRLVKLANDNEKLLPALFCGTLGSIALLPYALGGFVATFYPDADNEYLPKYKNLLAVVEQVQKDGCWKWAREQSKS